MNTELEPHRVDLVGKRLETYAIEPPTENSWWRARGDQICPPQALHRHVRSDCCRAAPGTVPPVIEDHIGPAVHKQRVSYSPKTQYAVNIRLLVPPGPMRTRTFANISGSNPRNRSRLD